MLTERDIKTHYKNHEVRDTIIRLSTFESGSRAGMKVTPDAYTGADGNLKDSTMWYMSGGKCSYLSRKINLSSKFDYYKSIESCRTLYWTLNVFDSEIFKIDYKSVNKNESAGISRKYTTGYTFGVDIDKEHGKDIHDPRVKAAVEAMGQFYADKFRKVAPNSVYCLFSGGGIYVMVHHEVFKAYFDRFRNTDGWDMMLKTLLDAFDDLVIDTGKEFFKLHPEHVGKVKPDALNGSQRVFKSIFSIHKKLDYAVIPLNPEKIEINFERASIPLKPDVIDSGKDWYSKHDSESDFLNKLLKPYLYKNYSENDKRGCSPVSNTASEPIPFEEWAPCMQNLYKLPMCGEGKTRALAIFVSFLGQIGYGEETARALFNDVAGRWNAEKSNIFESYFRNMKTPTCDRLMSIDNRGFPKGVSIKKLDVCKPDKICMVVPSPRYYTDKKANETRVLGMD